MIKSLFPYRFELFLLTQIFILFGALFIPAAWFESLLLPLLHILNFIAGIILVWQRKILYRFLLVLLFPLIIVTVLQWFNSVYDFANKLTFALYFLFHTLVAYEVVRQVWRTKEVTKHVILGLISGYISMGLVAFFICMSIEVMHPNSFSGLILDNATHNDVAQQLLYFSYITLLTIGYGDILPVTPLAQKAAIFIGLSGQFYLVILTAIVVGKYINQKGR